MGNPSDPAGTGTKTYEELQRELESVNKSREYYKQSYEEAQREIDERGGRPAAGEAELDDASQRAVTKIIQREFPTIIESVLDKRDRIQAEKQKQVAEQATQFRNKRAEWLKKAGEDFKDGIKPGSKLQKLAVEVFNDPKEGLSVQGQDGLFYPTDPRSEYDAYTRAALKLQAKGESFTEAAANAALSSTDGGGGGAPPVNPGDRTKLSDEEYLKMTPEQRSKWQQDEFKRLNP